MFKNRVSDQGSLGSFTGLDFYSASESEQK